MAGRDAQRAPVTPSQDPLQLSLTQPETWAIPRAQDPSAATSSCQELALRVAPLGLWLAMISDVVCWTSDRVPSESPRKQNSQQTVAKGSVHMSVANKCPLHPFRVTHSTSRDPCPKSTLHHSTHGRASPTQYGDMIRTTNSESTPPNVGLVEGHRRAYCRLPAARIGGHVPGRLLACGGTSEGSGLPCRRRRSGIPGRPRQPGIHRQHPARCQPPPPSSAPLSPPSPYLKMKKVTCTKSSDSVELGGLSPPLPIPPPYRWLYCSLLSFEVFPLTLEGFRTLPKDAACLRLEG